MPVSVALVIKHCACGSRSLSANLQDCVEDGAATPPKRLQHMISRIRTCKRPILASTGALTFNARPFESREFLYDLTNFNAVASKNDLFIDPELTDIQVSVRRYVLPRRVGVIEITTSLYAILRTCVAGPSELLRACVRTHFSSFMTTLLLDCFRPSMLGRLWHLSRLPFNGRDISSLCRNDTSEPAIAQLVEHLTVDACRNQMVPGLIPGGRMTTACRLGVGNKSLAAKIQH